MHPQLEGGKDSRSRAALCCRVCGRARKSRGHELVVPHGQQLSPGPEKIPRETTDSELVDLVPVAEKMEVEKGETLPGASQGTHHHVARAALGGPGWTWDIMSPVTVSVHGGWGYTFTWELVPLCSLDKGTSCSAFCIPPCTKPTLAFVFAPCLWEKVEFVESDHPVGLPRQALPVLAGAGVCQEGFGGPELHAGGTALRILCFTVPRLPA